MKIIFTFVCAFFLMVASAGADTILGSANVSPSNPATEEAWLEGLLGLTYNDPDVSFISKIENGYPIDQKAAISYNPGFSWQYAIVKIGGGGGTLSHIAYTDNGTIAGGNDVLEAGAFAKDISHISFFNGVDENGNGNGNGTKVPEPGTLFLLGFGLVAVAGLATRRKIR